MGEKYFSEEPGYLDCFIEVSDRWTMRELKRMSEADENEYFDLFNQKVDSMFLRDTMGREFVNPREFTPADVDDFDITLAGFVGSILPIHCRRRKSLGGLNVRPLSSGLGTAKTKSD